MSYKVWIMRGLPGSGKTTWVKDNLPDALVYSTDHLFIVNGKYLFDPNKHAEYHNANLRLFTLGVTAEIGQAFVVDNTNLNTWELAPYYRLAEAFGCEVEIVQMDTPLEVCLARNTHKVPEYRMGMMFATMLTAGIPPWWKITRIPYQK